MSQELLIVCRIHPSIQISVEGPFRIKGVLMFSREVMHKYIVDYNSYQLKCELDHYHCSLKFMSLYKICKTWLTNITIANLQCSTYHKSLEDVLQRAISNWQHAVLASSGTLSLKDKLICTCMVEKNIFT